MFTDESMGIILRKTTPEASEKYDKYLEEHITNVKKAYDWMSKRILRPELVTALNHVIPLHDSTKETHCEYAPYANYFYVDKNEYQDEFNYAWLHHIHNNPHHWQYWVLINDEDGTKALEMPEVDVVHMICDWWAFSWSKGNLKEIFNWYADHKANMIMHKETRKLVEQYLNQIKDILDDEIESQ